jgi:hypothetical protein
MQDSERKGGGDSGPREPRARVALPSKSLLLASADKLNYAGRISLAGRIGADHKGTAELGQLLAQLREVRSSLPLVAKPHVVTGVRLPWSSTRHLARPSWRTRRAWTSSSLRGPPTRSSSMKTRSDPLSFPANLWFFLHPVSASTMCMQMALVAAAASRNTAMLTEELKYAQLSRPEYC